ncbi:MAG: hypothetical protein KAT53_07330 [Dehalococcoidia bacterium]|nr:hypothetical protein [Dehalococcoidia bacterium]
MIELVCAGCSDRACAEDDIEEIWSHDKLMDCISRHVKVRPWLVFTDADIIGTFGDLDNSGVLEFKIPEGFKIEDHMAEIIAELPKESMIKTINERLWDEVLIYIENNVEVEPK